MKKYDVLDIVYHEAGKDHKGDQQYTVSWKIVGKANNMEEARKFLRYPVLQERK